MIDYLYIDEETTLEDLIMNEQFVHSIRNCSREELDQLIEKYQYRENLINDAITIIRYTKLQHVGNYTDTKKDLDWERLSAKITQYDNSSSNKRSYKLFAAIASAVACIVLILVIIPQYFSSLDNAAINSKAQMQSISSLVELPESEIQLVAGEIKTEVENNSIIAQTEKGDVKINDKPKIEESNITAEFLTLTVPYGKKAVLELSDGTRAWINSGTKVVYPKKFDKKRRDIVVDGEIYLDVVKDSRPFIVHANDVSVRVLGTKFNINSYSDSPSASVVLVEGIVEIENGEQKKKLEPNQGAFLADNIIDIKNVDIEMYVAWKDGYTILKNESLDDVVARLSKYYGVKINLNPMLKDIGYSGKLILDVPIEEVLDNIAVYTNVNYVREGNVIYIE